MKYAILAILILGAAFSQAMAQNTPIVLWENGAPNAKGNAAEDVPTITPFFAPKETATGAAILVLPGGGMRVFRTLKKAAKLPNG